MPPGEEHRGTVCGKIECTFDVGGGTKPGQSARPCGPGASRRPYRDRERTPAFVDSLAGPEQAPDMSDCPLLEKASISSWRAPSHLLLVQTGTRPEVALGTFTSPDPAACSPDRGQPPPLPPECRSRAGRSAGQARSRPARPRGGVQRANATSPAITRRPPPPGGVTPRRARG